MPMWLQKREYKLKSIFKAPLVFKSAVSMRYYELKEIVGVKDLLHIHYQVLTSGSLSFPFHVGNSEVAERS